MFIEILTSPYLCKVEDLNDLVARVVELSLVQCFDQSEQDRCCVRVEYSAFLDLR
jgi:hypothetical protein